MRHDEMTDLDHIRVMVEDGTRGMIERLHESLDAWGFGGGLLVSKDKGLFRADGHGPLPLHRDCHFERVPFDLPDVGLSGTSGWAVFFRQYRADAPARRHRGMRWYLCGWVPVERGDELREWLDLLNAAIERQVQRIEAASSPTSSPAPIEDDASVRFHASVAWMRSLGLPVPEAENVGELMTKLEEMSKDGPIDMREPRRSAADGDVGQARDSGAETALPVGVQGDRGKGNP